MKGGLQAKSKRGAIGQTWWSKRFLQVLEEFNDPGRLSRGRAYARRGQVIDLDIEAGEVTARVQGSRVRPYNVSIDVAVLDDAAWSRVETVLASRAVFLARLLAGEMPQEIEEAFGAAGLSLFPVADRDVDTGCSCPDWENPCKHIAAAYYILAEAFDRDPFLIFAWRGRPRERLLAELRELRGLASGTPAPDPADEQNPATLDAIGLAGGLFGPSALDDPDLAGELTAETASRFWEAGRDLKSIRVEPRVVAMPDAILRELGPSGLLVGGRPLEDLLAPAYSAIASAALRVAGGEEPAEPNLSPTPRQAAPRRATPRRPIASPKGPSRALLDRLVDAATVDCYDEFEERTGLFEMIRQHLDTPFVTAVLGVAVGVTAIDLMDDGPIVAVCQRGGDVLRISLLDLPLPDPRPGGSEWVDAYRHWARPR
ncbi:MAG TPA: SWIM zinc finger family protein [Candidatus Limnocylindrales bacterium]